MISCQDVYIDICMTTETMVYHLQLNEHVESVGFHELSDVWLQNPLHYIALNNVVLYIFSDS